MLLRLDGLTALFALGFVGPVLAQTDPAAMAHMAAANQLGILEYCATQGFLESDAVAAEHDVISHLPASSVPTGDAEALGKQGTLAAPNGTRMTLADMAGTRNTTVSAMCKQMASSTVQVDAAYKQNGMTAGGMPAMPAMPGGMPAMPAMPGGMPTMPAMPGGMPTMPGTPGAAPAK